MIKALALMGQLGYGYNRDSFSRALDEGIDYIGVDAGSIDSGPYFLGSGCMKANYDSTRSDLEYPLVSAVKNGIPFIVGSAGYAGADAHLEQFMQIVKDIASKNRLKIKVAVIHTELDKRAVVEFLRMGRIVSYESNPPLSEDDIEQSTRIVAQMGVGKIIEALELGVDLVVAGRTTDASIYAAYPLLMGEDEAASWHMSKIIECGALCARPASASDALLGWIEDKFFYLKPPNESRRCTPESAMAHALYENIDPYVIEEPDGTLFLNDCKYEQFDERTVRVTGARWVKRDRPTLKLEGAKLVGYRSIAVAGIRDPAMIRCLDDILDEVRANRSLVPEGCTLRFRCYGRDGVLGDLEFDRTTHEIGLIIDVVAPSQSQAHSICSKVKSHLQHYDYPNRVATGANLAFPYSPAEIDAGAVYTFSVYHILEVEKPDELFRMEVIQL